MLRSLLAASAACLLALAAEGRADVVSFVTHGTLAEIGRDAVVVQVTDDDRIPLTLEDTEIFVEGARISPDEMARTVEEGTPVRASFVWRAGERVATRLDLEPG